MPRLTIYKDDHVESTVVSNLFIDEYMKDANDAQLKVYLYLLRMMNARQATSVSDMADKFNHTEKDVMRALKYWQDLQLLELDYDDRKNLVGIHIRDLFSRTGAENPSVPRPVSSFVPSPTAEAPASISRISSPENRDLLPETAEDALAKPSYSADQLKEFKNRQDTSQLLFIAESYIGRPLTPGEVNTILYFKDVLRFSDDLIDYLIQYCVDRGKKELRYIEKVAVSWAQQGVTTPGQAAKLAGRYDKSVYEIMKALGKNGTPTKTEVAYITRWTKEYGFDTDIIFTACERTVLATDKHRFEYADRILASWQKSGVHSVNDIQSLDEHYRRTKPSRPASGNKFNQFTQNSYDFEALEQELISN